MEITFFRGSKQLFLRQTMLQNKEAILIFTNLPLSLQVINLLFQFLESRICLRLSEFDGYQLILHGGHRVIRIVLGPSVCLEGRIIWKILNLYPKNSGYFSMAQTTHLYITIVKYFIVNHFTHLQAKKLHVFASSNCGFTFKLLTVGNIHNLNFCCW